MTRPPTVPVPLTGDEIAFLRIMLMADRAIATNSIAAVDAYAEQEWKTASPSVLLSKFAQRDRARQNVAQIDGIEAKLFTAGIAL